MLLFFSCDFDECFKFILIPTSISFISEQLSKFTSVMYAEMPPEEKEQWATHAEADKDRYLAELGKYVPPPGYDSKGDAIECAQRIKSRRGNKVAKDSNAPKKSE